MQISTVQKKKLKNADFGDTKNRTFQEKNPNFQAREAVGRMMSKLTKLSDHLLTPNFILSFIFFPNIWKFA